LYVGRTYSQTSIVALSSILFFVQAFFVFMCVAALPFFVEERATYSREKANGWYTALPYALAAVTSSLPGTFAIAISTSIVLVFMVALNNFGYFLGETQGFLREENLSN